MEAALTVVNEHGWTTEALAAGAMKAGFPAVTHGLFPRGGGDLVHHVLRRANVAVSDALQSADLSALSVNDRIRLGVETRLRTLAPYQKTWAQAMAVGALPSHAVETGRLLAVGADEVWYLSGDRSTDTTWYTRRLLLCGVTAVSEVYMLTDRSHDLANTWTFLARRIQEANAWGDTVGSTLHMAGAAGSGMLSVAEAAVHMAAPLIQSAVAAVPWATVTTSLQGALPLVLKATDAVLPPLAGALVRTAAAALITMNTGQQPSAGAPASSSGAKTGAASSAPLV